MLLVEVDDNRDPNVIANQVINHPGPAGTGWRIRHTSARPHLTSRQPDNPPAGGHGQPTRRDIR